MSGEFRWCERGHLHSVLEYYASAERGEQPLSQALADLYAAIQPLEEACAWVEASDSGPSNITLACHRHRAALIAATNKVREIVSEQAALVDEIVRRGLESPPKDAP